MSERRKFEITRMLTRRELESFEPGSGVMVNLTVAEMLRLMTIDVVQAGYPSPENAEVAMRWARLHTDDDEGDGIWTFVEEDEPWTMMFLEIRHVADRG